MSKQQAVTKFYKILPDLMRTVDFFEWGVDCELAKLGLNYTDLISEDYKTVEAVKANLNDQYRTGMIEIARANFDILATTEDPDVVRSAIDRALKAANVGHEKLDRDEKKSAIEMLAEADGRHTDNVKKKAVEFFDALLTSYDPTIYEPALRRALNILEVGYEILDPTGQTTSEQMKALVTERLERRLAEIATVDRKALAFCMHGANLDGLKT